MELYKMETASEHTKTIIKTAAEEANQRYRQPLTCIPKIYPSQGEWGDDDLGLKQTIMQALELDEVSGSNAADVGFTVQNKYFIKNDRVKELTDEFQHYTSSANYTPYHPLPKWGISSTLMRDGMD